MPYVSRTKRRRSISKIALVITAICAAVAVVLLLLGLFAKQQEVRAANVAAAEAYTPAPVATAPSVTTPPNVAPVPFTPVPEVMARLSNASQPWTMTVIGDSTGNAEDEWVYLSAESLGEQYDRPVIVHNWSVELNRYDSETSVGQGSGEPIIVWNGSASGAPPTYSNEHRETLAPQPSDLVIINHGHNMGDVENDMNELSEIADWVMSNQESAPALAVTLQNPRLDEQADRQAQIAELLEGAWPDRGAAVIDVRSAFNDFGDISVLVQPDGFHPNTEGEVIWAETVLTALSG
jgi:hypothetical protein